MSSVDIMLLIVRSQLAELRKERSSLAKRLHTAEKTSALQQQELQSQLHSVEQSVQLRERDLMHVHQQYQMLYQQFILLQQQAASSTVRFHSIYVWICWRDSCEVHKFFCHLWVAFKDATSFWCAVAAAVFQTGEFLLSCFLVWPVTPKVNFR